MQTRSLQTLFLLIGFAFIIFACVLSFQKDYGTDIAADGGAAGFAILGGICILCVTILQLRSKEENKENITSSPIKFAYANRLASLALNDFNNNNFDSCIKRYREAISLFPSNSIWHYNIACAYAKENDQDKVLFHLEKAVENGYENFEKIKSNPHFEELIKKEIFIEFICNGYKVITNN